jgi:hypothetical protein
MGAGRVAGPASLLRNAMRDAHTGHAHTLRGPLEGVTGWLVTLATLVEVRAWDGIALPGNHHATVGGVVAKGNSTGAWLVTLVRAGYGVALVVAPQALIQLTGDPGTGQPAGASWARPGRRACGVARVLGARHLIQAGLTSVALRAVEPDPSLPLGLGAAVDVLHATTMGLAAVDRGARRVALADTGVEVMLAAAGLISAAK